MSTYMLAKGSKLWRKNPTTSSYQEIPQCTVLTGPQIRQDFDEITNHSSAGGYKEYAATLRDGGELPLEVLWDIINISIHVVLYDDAVAEPLPVSVMGRYFTRRFEWLGFSRLFDFACTELGFH